MKFRFLWIVLAAVWLAGCATAGSPGQTTVIVVTATPPPAAQDAAPDPYGAPAATATQPAVPANNPAPTTPPTNPPAAVAAASPTPNVPLPATGPAAQVSIRQLLDFTLVDAAGSPLGDVDDVVIQRSGANGAAGEIPYLVVESSLKDDFRIPVPWQNAQLRPDLFAIVLPVNASQLANAPAFNEDFWPASFAPHQAALQNFWSNPGAAPAAAALPAGNPLQARDYIIGEDLLSVDLNSPQGINLGEVEDLAIDWQNSQPGTAAAGQFAYVVVELDDALAPNNLLVPVPLRLLPPATGLQDDVVINLAPNVLQSAPNFAGLVPNLYEEPLLSQLNAFWTGK
jgi:hypothetical protein